MPAGLGWHPYFPRMPRTTITAVVAAMWRTDDAAMPTALVPLPVTADLTGGVTADRVALDNCFVGWSRRAVIEWAEPGTQPTMARLTMTAAPPLDFLVVYTPADRPYFCVEPVSHVTDAFNLAAAGRTDAGVHTLPPGATLRAAVTLTPEAGT
jgi:aldose 1-epimerase